MPRRCGVEDDVLVAGVVHVVQKEVQRGGFVGARSDAGFENVVDIALVQGDAEVFEFFECGADLSAVLADSVLGVDFDAPEVDIVVDSRRFVADWRVKDVRKRVCGVRRDDERRVALAGVLQRGRGRTGGLADAAFPAVEYVLRHVRLYGAVGLNRPPVRTGAFVGGG